MRIELAGSLIRPDPIVLRLDQDRAGFNILGYIDAGYTNFEVICIGGAGGQGGGIDTGNAGNHLKMFGGAGGGGGFHRVRGLLSVLPPLVPIVVGVGGTLGNDHISDPTLTTNGGDGGYSSFNGTTCRASGGKGGKRVQNNTIFEGTLVFGTLANGGDGGVGDRIIAGGGGLGGIAGDPGASDPTSKNGVDGILFHNNIGEGGGGGAGGIGQYGSSLPYPTATVNAASAGGRGSYNQSDVSVYGPAGNPTTDPNVGNSLIMPGGASGAKASPLNGLSTVYGQSNGTRSPASSGIVIVLLTAE